MYKRQLRYRWFELLGFIPDKIRKILAGTCFVLGAILASLANANLTGTDGFFEFLILFPAAVFLLIISAFLWPWGSTIKAIKTHVDAQVTDEEQERIWELSRYPGSMDTADTLAEMYEEESQS